MIALYENVCTWGIWIFSNKLPIDLEFHSKDSKLKAQSKWIWFQVHSLGVVFLSAVFSHIGQSLTRTSNTRVKVCRGGWGIKSSSKTLILFLTRLVWWVPWPTMAKCYERDKQRIQQTVVINSSKVWNGTMGNKEASKGGRELLTVKQCHHCWYVREELHSVCGNSGGRVLVGLILSSLAELRGVT